LRVRENEVNLAGEKVLCKRKIYAAKKANASNDVLTSIRGF